MSQAPPNAGQAPGLPRVHDTRPRSNRWATAKAAVFPVDALRGRLHQ